MKHCTGKCGRLLPLDAFFKRRHSVDGHRHQCKDCIADMKRADRVANPEKYAAKERARSTDPKRMAYDKSRRTRPHRLELQRLASIRYRQRYPEHVKARARLGGAVRYGSIKRQPCFYCDNSATEAHHFDYSRPFDVVWLCTYHHRELDGRPTGEWKAA